MRIAELSEKDFERFKRIIYSEAGIKLSDLKKALVQARLSKRLRALHLRTYTDYYDYLVENFEDEKIEFINAITTNKTDFFREQKHFDFIVGSCLPEFEDQKRRSIRVWSAGCSSGEEPYTIAIILKEYFKDKKDIDIKVLATDIDTNMLDKAKAGIYSFDQIEPIQIDILKKYFYRGSGENEGLFKVKDSLKEIVYFRRLNLLDRQFPMSKKFDIIFCRNVIIYFDKFVQKQIMENIWNYLENWGYLFIGHSENITAITNRFRLVGHTIYQKGPVREEICEAI